MTDVAFLDALEQARLIRARELSSSELVDLYLERIDRFNEQLGAYVTVAADSARESAARADAANRDGDDLLPFHGVPIAIKDLTCTAGIRTTFSSAVFEDFVPAVDDHVVRRLREAGFVILGKTNTPEFGALPVTESAMHGPCRNPWDLAKTAGGSSGGSAAAVTAGLAPVAQGTDGGGSVRIPASCCGLFGIKPSRGRISLGPRLGDGIAGSEVVGFMGRTVADVAAVLDVASGYETGDPYWAPDPERPFRDAAAAEPPRLRVGMCVTAAFRGEIDASCVDATRDAAALLESMGHHVEEACPDFGGVDVIEHLDKLWCVAAAYFAGSDAIPRFEPANQVFSGQALGVTSYEYVRATVEIARAARAFVAFWDDYDVLLTPTLGLPPVPIGWYYGGTELDSDLERDHSFVHLWTPMANVTGQPAVSLPTARDADGLPIGVQLIGPPAGEALLFSISAAIEKARPWSQSRPEGYV
jgi:amidase